MLERGKKTSRRPFRLILQRRPLRESYQGGSKLGRQGVGSAGSEGARHLYVTVQVRKEVEKGQGNACGLGARVDGG